MTKSIINKMEEAMLRPVPYEGLSGRENSSASRKSEYSEDDTLRNQNFASSRKMQKSLIRFETFEWS